MMRVAFIGGGSFATALANLSPPNGNVINIFDLEEPEISNEVNSLLIREKSNETNL